MSRQAPIDLDKLERELVGALEADRKYSRENDAKFRAVHQKVATYEEFRYESSKQFLSDVSWFTKIYCGNAIHMHHVTIGKL